VRVKATHQISGQLDNLTALARRVCLDWDQASSRWIKRATSNPASLYRLVLQHPSNPKRVADSELDLELLQDWHEICTSKSLAYNRVLDQAGTSLRDVLTEIAAAGRATPRHDGTRWGVVIDRPQELVVDHIGPRNSWGFKIGRTYNDPPQALVVTFNDETNDYKQTQRVIPRPGYTGEIDLTEALSLPGITDPDLIYRETLRRWYEILHRPDTYELIQDGVTGVTTRGDLVRISHDIPSSVQVSARVVDTQGVLMLLDEEVKMISGVDYNLRFRRFSENDTIGTSQIRSVVRKTGRTNLIELTGPGYRPKTGDQVFFGPVGQESFEAIVTGTEVTEDMCTILRLVDAAPEIDALTDAAVIPAWSGRVGAELDDNLLEPSAPIWKRIYSAVTSAGRPVDIEYLISAGTGAVGSARFEIDRRIAGASGWSTITIPAASGGGDIAGYASGNSVELRARAISVADIAGPYGPTITHLVGKGGSGLPLALDEDSISVTALLGAALVQFAGGSDKNTRQIQIYRSMSPVLDREIDAVGSPITVSAGGSYSKAIGDTTRANKLSSSAWTAGGGWTVSGGTASHAGGTAGELSQSVSLGTGKFYRFGLVVSGASAGSLTPRLTGGSTVSGDVLTGSGLQRGRLQAVTGNNEFGLMASYDFDGAITSAVLYLQTASCLAQGTHYLWLEPQTADGAPGPVTGPYTLEVI
ncbi:MAG: phage tail protein, partial [Paracoccus sp. (in: a-proteobacteria)]